MHFQDEIVNLFFLQKEALKSKNFNKQKFNKIDQIYLHKFRHY